MAKKPTISTISSGYYSRTALNDNFTNIRDKFDNTLSLDGSTPNAMGADLDMNSNDILNANNIDTTSLRIGGVLASPTSMTYNDASEIDYNQGGTGAVTRTVENRLQDFVSVKDFGAVGDGVADDTAAIQAALDSGASEVVFPAGSYRTTSSITVDGDISLRGVGLGLTNTIIIPDASVLEGLQVGATTLWQGAMRDIIVSRSAYSGATENIGIAFYDMAECLVENVSSRFSKYPIRFKPQTSDRVGYTTFVNLRAVGGYYNISSDLQGTGWFNEVVFLGGRCFTTSDTVSNVYLDDPVNHIRFIGMSLEGTGDQAVYLNGVGANKAHSCQFLNCRTEGTWAVDDIVLGAETLRNEVHAWNLYTTVSDSGVDNLITTATQGMVIPVGYNLISPLTLTRSGEGTNVPVLDMEDTYTTGGSSFGIKYSASRGTGYLLQLLYSTTELFSVSLISATQALLTNIGRALFSRNASDMSSPLVKVSDEYSSSGSINAVEVANGRSAGSVLKSTRISDGQEGGRIELVNNSWQVKTRDSGFSTAPLVLGAYYLWVDSTGDLRIKNGAPTSDTDGTVVGTQT